MPQTALIPVRLSAPAPGPGSITVHWATRSGTVTAGVSFVAASGTVSWAAGEQVKNIQVTILDNAPLGVFYVDLTTPNGAVIAVPISTVTLISDLLPVVQNMLDAHWAYIQRATGAAAADAGMPPLVTAEGLVKNNQHPETLLGGYLPDGAATSEGISLMLRGVASGYAARQDAARLAYCRFLMDAACEHFFFGDRPSATPGTRWDHTWLVHAGSPFSVRGPLASNGDVAQGGYIGMPITFTAGVGQITPPPSVLYQVVTADAEFVWQNVFSELTAGSAVAVAYYIDRDGNKVFGTQKSGSFGQPIQPGSEETPGKVVLAQALTGTYLVNFSVPVLGTTIAHGEAYEGWPMWRKLGAEERSMAGDAIHWFVDAFRMLATEDPDYAEWALAHARMLETWQEACAYASEGALIFQAGTTGSYDSFPLTYAYAYGRNDVDDPDSTWHAVPPDPKIPVGRTSDGYVTFTMPSMIAAPESGLPIRYGFAFENEPVFLTFTGATSLSIDMRSDATALAQVELTDDLGTPFLALVPVPPGTSPQQVRLPAFRSYPETAVDSDGLASGDWSGDEPYVPPEYDPVPFPGRRAALVGDSITYQNTLWNPPIDGRYEYQSLGQGGWFNWAMGFCNHRLELEPGIQPNVNGTHSGYAFGIAGSKIADWWQESWEPFPGAGLSMGPMHAFHQAKANIDLVLIMGGTNDLAGNRTAPQVLADLKRACFECASEGKWVFVQTITPRTTDLLQGYSEAQQQAIRERILTVNQGLRDWVTNDHPPNIYLVDTWDLLVGPNGIDPHGCVSQPSGTYTPGNWKPGVPQVSYFPDGLHPGVAAARVMGKVLSDALIAAGVPARAGYGLGPLTPGANLIANPTFTVTPTPWVPSNTLGRAIGLGPANPSAPGYQHGVVPDGWFVYRASNSDGESFSNFGSYTWSALVAVYPEVAPYMVEPSWPDGSLKTSVVTIDGAPAFKLEFAVDAGNRNESFVVRANIPWKQNGAWNNYGFNTWPQTPPPVNDAYAAGAKVGAEMEVRASAISRLHTMRLAANFLSLNDAAIGAGDNATTGAKISGLGFGQNYWPPSLIGLTRFHPDDFAVRMKTPIVAAPTPLSGERTYLQLNLDVGLTAADGPASVTLILRDPRVHVFGGAAL